MKKFVFAALGLLLVGGGCLASNVDVATCTETISIAEGGYTSATFTYPCDWDNDSTESAFTLTSPDGTAELTYPSSFEGGLPPGGEEKTVMIEGVEHKRYLADWGGESGALTAEMIGGPIFDDTGMRAFMKYPDGSHLGDVMLEVLTSVDFK